MRIHPIPPQNLSATLRDVHDQIIKLVTNKQEGVNMLNSDGALLGPFIPMLQYPQFGVTALEFIRSVNTAASLPPTLREIAILTVAGIYGARFELYAHEIMAQAFSIPKNTIAMLASGGHPINLNEEQAIVHNIASTLLKGKIIPDATYEYATKLLGENAIAELYFLIGSYSLIATILNGFDIPAPLPGNQSNS
jgi:4-carboxymuconolactone decarboxylase